MTIKFIFQLIRAANAFSAWYKKATEDGKIDPGEIAEFIKEFADIFNFNVSVTVPDA